MSQHFPPKFSNDNFHCPFCGVFSRQQWRTPLASPPNKSHGEVAGLNICFCEYCNNYSIWFKGTMIHPASGSAPAPHEDMPPDVQGDYNEARQIVGQSPRAAAALLRLAIQRLTMHLGEKGKNLDDDIGNLVKKGLPVRIQQAWDAVRIAGNESVHPGEINLNDTPELAQALFGLVNIIVDNQIAEPKRIEAVYMQMPERKRQAIENRDK